MSDTKELSPLLVKSIQFAAPAVLWFGRHFLKWNRLEHIDRIQLGVTIQDVAAAYGASIESNEDDEFTEAIVHTFSVGPFHEGVICEWKGQIHSITYWSKYSAPAPDLECMLDTYGQGIGWNVIEAGYWYFRKDNKIRLWCSAAPAIGVATAEFLEAKGAKEQITQG